MRSPAVAIAWEFVQRHRWGFAALAGYLLILGTTDVLVFEPGQVDLDADLPFIAWRFAATVMVPVSLFTYYFVAVFSFGLTGNMAARESMYPTRMFALPVTNAALAGWPMLYGTATLAGLLLAATRFALWPSGIDVPLIWPALFAASSLAWIQALVWMPYGLPGLRVVVAVLCLATTGPAVVTAVEFEVSEAVMVAALAPQIPLAYLAARFAVAMARRGDVPDWRQKLARLGQLIRLVDILPRRRTRFPSAAHAQRWFEWQLHGRSLPVWVAILLPFELALLFVAGNNTPDLVAYTVFGALLTPPFMAAFSVPRMRQSGPQASDGHGMPPFVATRPLASAALIAAKLRMSVWSTLVTWLLVLTAIPIALTWSGTWPVVTERARELSDAVGTPRAVVVALLGLAALVASTWKQLVQSLYIGLSGREWLLRSSACLTLTVLIFIEPIVEWIRGNSEVRIALWNALPWTLAALACLKTSAAGWIATRLHRRRLLSDRVLVTVAACWLVAVLALFSLLSWFLSGPLIPRYLLLLLAILAVPLARVSAAPLALAWNRHR